VNHTEKTPPDQRVIDLPSEGTAAALAFVKAASADDRFFHFIIDTVLSGDYFAYIARQAIDGKQDYKGKTPTDLALTDPGPRTKFLRENSQALLEMFVARLVDNFQTYVVDIVREVLHCKPSILSTRQQSFTLEEILSYERIEDLVHDVVERKVNSLSYEGFEQLQRWCAERGIEIKVPASNRTAVIELIATRNIIAHNRGAVDERYHRAVSATAFETGARRELNVDYQFEAAVMVIDIVVRTDEAIRTKFGLALVKMALPSKMEVPPTEGGTPNERAPES
jgi:hypothetical protein